MFTGIVEEVGIVKEIRKGSKSSEITIMAKEVLKETIIGDSICTNGVCLTVMELVGENIFKADVMAETLRRSNLGDLHIGSKVNLERALTLNKRLGGHIVTGHIDTTGRIISLEREDNSLWITIKTNRDFFKYIVEKGSIAIDGVSLTIAFVDRDIFKVSIIPHTMKNTILLEKNIGDTVNLEGDIIGKYVENFMESNKKGISKDFLIENGFM